MTIAFVRLAGILLVATCVVATSAAAQQPQPETDLPTAEPASDTIDHDTPDFDAQLLRLTEAAVRLPLAAGLACLTAMRPRRRGAPARNPSVIQTQIILSVIGALVMLVVGSSLARAFGIVGAAGLVRYRAKVDDTKEAGVMLSTLAVGLAAGVGLYLLAAFGAVFVLGVLWVIESIDPEPYSLFELTITAKDAPAVKDGIEGVLRRRKIPFELRGTSAEETSYEVKLPLGARTARVSALLMALGPAGAINVKWVPKKDSKPS